MSGMKIYKGTSDELQQAGPVMVTGGEEDYPLSPRTDLRNHSPTGFAWGYYGSGPSQLALALLIDATGNEDIAVRLYQQYKNEVIAELKGSSWQITQADVLDWVGNKLKEQT